MVSNNNMQLLKKKNIQAFEELFWLEKCQNVSPGVFIASSSSEALSLYRLTFEICFLLSFNALPSLVYGRWSSVVCGLA